MPELIFHLLITLLSPQVSALALDPSGARLVTGGYDFDVRFWDFAGMDQALQAFRSLQPCEWCVHFWEHNTQLLNICLISSVQTSTLCLCLPKSTQTHLSGFIEPHVNSATSSRFIQNEPFQKQMVEICSCLCVQACLFWVSSGLSSEIKFSFWESAGWAGAGLRLLTQMYAALDVIQ